jgi:hypothetical protein
MQTATGRVCVSRQSRESEKQKYNAFLVAAPLLPLCRVMIIIMSIERKTFTSSNLASDLHLD